MSDAMTRPPIIIIPLLLGLLLLIALPPARAACGADALWALCQRDRLCTWLFRKDGAAGVAAAMEYLALSARRGASPWAPAWRDLVHPDHVFGATVCSDAALAAAAGGNASAAAFPAVSAEGAFAVAVLTQLRGFMAAGEHGCTDPHEFPVYDSVTEQYACVCAEGHVCNTSDDASATTLSTNYVLFIVTLSLVGAVMLAALVAAPLMLKRATDAVVEAGRRAAAAAPASR